MKYFPGSKTDMVAMETKQWNKFVENLRRYRCEICGLQCRNKSGLETHLRIHTGEKPFRCSLCGRGFARGYDLKIHVNSCRKKSTWGPRKMSNIVQGVRRYRCEIHGLKFSGLILNSGFLRQTFQRKSATKCWIKKLIIASVISFQIIWTHAINQFNFIHFCTHLARFEILKFRVLENWTFTHGNIFHPWKYVVSSVVTNLSFRLTIVFIRTRIRIIAHCVRVALLVAMTWKYTWIAAERNCMRAKKNEQNCTGCRKIQMRKIWPWDSLSCSCAGGTLWLC